MGDSEEKDVQTDLPDGDEEAVVEDMISKIQDLDESGNILKRQEPRVSSERVSETPPPPPEPSQLKKEGAVKIKRSGQKYDQLRKNPSMQSLKNDDMETLEKLSEVVAPVSKAIRMIESFERKYKGFCNEEKMASFRTQLRETSAVMLAEFYSLRHGRQNKVYDESKICKICHSVFMVKLPENRICDACKSSVQDD